MPTPGVLFLLRTLPSISLPVFGLYGGLYILRDLADIPTPPLLKWSIWIAACPLALFAKIARNSWTQSREAARLGATSVPVTCGKLPGNIDVLMELKHVFETGYVAEQFWPLTEKLGNIVNIQLLWSDALFTTEPAHIKQILATEFNNFEKGDQFISAAHSVLGVGVFNSDGDMWKFHRSMTRPFFSRERISHFDLFTRHADQAIVLMQQCFREGYSLDMQDLLGRFTLDSASEFLFGKCMHALRAGLPYPHNAQLGSTARDEEESRCEAERFNTALASAQMTIGERT
ncbi:cytochrome P450 [Phellopilus nigrolimitatus]|nr:cytochrome P450 [Phellopilus nigrolimitatus]